MSEKKHHRSRTRIKKQTLRGFAFIQEVGEIKEFELTSNGMRVLYARVPGSPTVTTNIVYRVGSQHEQNGETGLAHMLEHMLFKPTQNPTVTWKELEERGALLNATTWLDRTMYYFDLPTRHLDDMLTVEANRMRNLILTDDEFLPERANVLSEYEMYNSKPEVALEWHIVASAFESHGYHHDTIGFKSDIEGFTIEKLRSFYNRHYWPNNATLIVAGDIPLEELLSYVKHHFGGLERGEPVSLNSTPEQTQEGMRRVVLERETPMRFINITFKAPRFASREWTALQLALSHLAEGEMSVLYKKLVETGLATSVSARIYPTKDPFLAFFEIFATEKTPYEKIEKIVLEAIDACKKKLLTNTELALHKEELYSEDLFSRDGAMSIASQLAEYVATGDWTRYYTGLDEIHAITAREVQDAVKKYLTIKTATIGTLVPPSS